ncbi:ribosomal protein L5 [Candidatus Carsonella ruddii PV]|uniref:50S ribosomal protein L5 n=2 Tax=Carsonella ruddii TaxID=114186 RepID=Q9AIF5_CARRU|nr:50S ribosomal protein L5 [Candidatus Carsonella ruddii]AAK17091.1 ribosomal protein L5 [Candidatus Carsonella ruddii]BAF35177.1 ribosomal protein L5 [Candidatus Carsonella ruddii PV]
MKMYYFKLIKEFSKKKNIFNPNIDKIIIRSGIAKFNNDKKHIKYIFESLNFITGQKPILIKIKKPISNFKSKKGDLACINITLRKNLMWNFYYKLINIVAPKIREFNGFKIKSLDRFGNFHFGIDDCSVFPDFFSEKKFGINISIVLKNLKKNFLEFYKLINFPIN